MGGLDVWLAGEDNMLPALDNSDKACDAMRNLVAEGNLGLRQVKGFFEYPEEKTRTDTDGFLQTSDRSVKSKQELRLNIENSK